MIEFKSYLAGDLEKYLAWRTEVGYRYKHIRWFLSTIDKYVIEKDITFDDLTSSVFLSFRKSLVDMEPGTVNRIFTMLNGFFEYMVRVVSPAVKNDTKITG